MKLDREDLQAVLKGIAPALYDKELVEELACYWFTPTSICAYDGEIGIEVSIETGIIGGVKGKLLLGLLANAKAQEVELSEGDGELSVQCKPTKATLVLMEGKRQPPWPARPQSAPITLTQAFLHCLKQCLYAHSNVDTRPDYLGITIRRVEQDLHFYASDGTTMSWMTTDRPEGWEVERITLPLKFCEQLVRLCEAGDILYLAGGVAEVLAGEETTIVGREIHIDRPADFADLLGRNVPDDLDAVLFPITVEFKDAITRAKSVSSKVKLARVHIESTGTAMKLSTEIGKASVVDTITIGKACDVDVVLDPKLVDRALPYADTMTITHDCIILSNEQSGLLHMIALIGARGR